MAKIKLRYEWEGGMDAVLEYVIHNDVPIRFKNPVHGERAIVLEYEVADAPFHTVWSLLNFVPDTAKKLKLVCTAGATTKTIATSDEEKYLWRANGTF